MGTIIPRYSSYYNYTHHEYESQEGRSLLSELQASVALPHRLNPLEFTMAMYSLLTCIIWECLRTQNFALLASKEFTTIARSTWANISIQTIIQTKQQGEPHDISVKIQTQYQSLLDKTVSDWTLAMVHLIVNYHLPLLDVKIKIRPPTDFPTQMLTVDADVYVLTLIYASLDPQTFSTLDKFNWSPIPYIFNTLSVDVQTVNLAHLEASATKSAVLFASGISKFLEVDNPYFHNILCHEIFRTIQPWSYTNLHILIQPKFTRQPSPRLSPGSAFLDSEEDEERRGLSPWSVSLDSEEDEERRE